MVVAYLNRIRDEFIEAKADIQTRLDKTLIKKKENAEFIKLLEKESNSSFEGFTPRTVNSFHKMKIEELKSEQERNEVIIQNSGEELEKINNKIKEVDAVILYAKEKKY